MNRPPRVLLVVNDAAFFLSHRLPIALAARDAGFDVHVATAPSDPTELIRAHGLPYHPIHLTRSGTNPFVELAVLWNLVRLFRALRPDLVHLVTPKPVVYGGIAARIAGIPSVVAAISGLGHVFWSNTTRARLTRPLVKAMYRLALDRPGVRAIFQNPSDRDLLIAAGAVDASRSVMIRGSGVDLSAFAVSPEPDQGPPVVTFAARLIEPKGVHDFVAAARRLRDSGVRARFLLAGATDPANPTSVADQDLDRWRQEGVVEVLGHRRDVADLFAASNLVVFPSYYGEGLPKVLIEAAASGRAIVTTDLPGCRDAIEPGRTGVLVPPRDVTALAYAIRDLLDDTARRRRMGLAGRDLAVREYPIEHVTRAHLTVYHELLRR